MFFIRFVIILLDRQYDVLPHTRTTYILIRRKAMKKTNKRIFIAIMCTVISSCALISCSEKAEPQTPSISSPSPGGSDHDAALPSDTDTVKDIQNEDTSYDIQTDTYKTQIAYYMSLTESLRSELLKIKEDKYIDACEYQLKINVLEQTIKSLNDAVASLTPPSVGVQLPENETLSARSDFRYIIDGGMITLTEYVGNSIDVIIPSYIDGYPVARIGEGAFKGIQIRSLAIPSGVTEIDWFAFSGCTALETIIVPSSVMSVGYGTFEYCPKTMVIKCQKDSYIEAYAKSWGICVETE